MNEISKLEIARNWLPRYTGMALDEFGDYILLTNFQAYIEGFAERFGVPIRGLDHPMQAASNGNGLTIVSFGIGTSNAATIMDLLIAIEPKGVLFLGKCGGLKQSTEIGHFIPPEVPALPSFKLHKFVSDKLREQGYEYRTGVVYTTNRRVWEHDHAFLEHLHKLTALAIDMETATLFIVGHANQIARGALLLVSDVPITPEGVKTEESDQAVTRDWTDVHLDLGINAMTEIAEQGEPIKHFTF